MTKRIMRGIGRDLAAMGAIPSWRDVFYLRLEEIRGCFDGTISHTELTPLVELRRRRQEEEAASGRSAPVRFSTRGPAYWLGNLTSWEATAGGAGDPAGESVLRGTPCGPGVAEGVAKVVREPQNAGRGVLVTYRTDPGWIAALPTASALLIERGSPLTHVAIVARELGIPTVVQIPGLTEKIKTGERVRVDGGAGTVSRTAAPADGEDE